MIVGVVDIIIGGWVTIQVLMALTQGHINLNVTVLLLPAAIGLLMRSNACRVVARVLHMLIPLSIATCFLMASVSGGSWAVTGPAPMVGLGIIIAIAQLAYLVWGFFVLGREDVQHACGWPPE